jgi:PTH2 family peptidyl-tRNA hydrolase
MTKQVIVMRKDLGMRKGKMIAQGAHASIAWLTRRLSYDGALDKDKKEEKAIYLAFLTPEEQAWITDRFTKICVYVESEEALLSVYEKAKEAGLTVNLIMDAGLTEFKEPTRTCLAIGPHEAEKIDEITGELPLL